ncbi:beta-phosphoglucomutase (plasmid) [Bryobacterales bacterium F-183]|nr:beta-phosphoglucomutase [Bryobacterales bacterium F-183]
MLPGNLVPGSSTKRFAAIVFDMDGVLVHSTPLHDQAYRTLLADFGITEFDYRPFAGRKTLDSVRILNDQHRLGLDEAGLRATAKRKTELALDLLRSVNPIASGACELLETLKKAGLRLAVASSASPESIDLFLDINNLRGFFEVVLSSADVREAKPSPEIYVKACERLGVLPAATAIVEDAVAGVEAGRGAGAVVFGVTGTYLAEDLLQSGTEVCVDQLLELVPFLTA